MRSEKQIADLENRVEKLEELVALQGGINFKLITALRDLTNQDKTMVSSLILPDRLNS